MSAQAHPSTQSAPLNDHPRSLRPYRYTLAERLYLPLVAGMAITIRHFLRNVFNRKSRLTIEYPEQRREYSHRFRGHHILTTRPDGSVRCVACFLCATAFVSLWISNTATAAMMLPIGLAVLAQLEHGEGGRRLSHYGMALMLAIAYGSNIGGIGTKIGTAPNAQFSGFMERRGVDISFLQFAAVGLPFVLLFLPVAWWFLARLARRDVLHSQTAGELIAGQRRSLGSLATGERLVLGVFLLTATLWILGRPLTEIVKRSWPSLGSAHVEGGIAVSAALLLLLLRSGGGPVLHPRSLKTVPWETLLLLGGGFAMAAAVQHSGLSKTMAQALEGLRGLPSFAQVLATSLATVAISAIASNTSTIAVMLVVLSDAMDPAIRNTVLFAATLACSCDFALPAGTPPNAIVFGSGYVSLPRMARTGAMLDVLAALVVALWCWLIVPLVIG